MLSTDQTGPDKRTVIKDATVFVGETLERRDKTDVAIQAGRIEAIGINLARNDDAVLDGSEFFVTPGFVNAHFHPSQQTNRALGVGLNHDAQMDLLHAADRIKQPEDRLWMSQIAVLEALHAGTTCFNSVGSEIETQIEVYRRLGVRAACSLFPKDLEDSSKHEGVRAQIWQTEERLRRAEELHRAHHSRLIEIHFGACNVKYCSDRLILGMLALAEKYGVGFHMHAAEGNEYVAAVLKRTGRRSIEHLHFIGALGPKVSLAHATKLNNEEIGNLAVTGTSIVHCPRANAYVATGNCPVKELVENGVNIGLGSDAAINNNSNEVRGEARAVADNLARTYHRPDVLSHLELFRMLTINGARALGFHSRTGTIDVGKAADLVLWSKNELPFIPGHDYIADLIFTDSCRAHTVFVEGRCILQNHGPVLVDESEVIRQARQISERYHARFASLPSFKT